MKIPDKIINSYLSDLETAFPVFGVQLAGSSFWQETGDTYSCGYYGESGNEIVFTYRDFKKTHGCVLPDTPITQEDIISGQKEVLVKLVDSSGEEIFGIHMHRGEHDWMHIQRGNKRKEIPFDASFQTVGDIGSEIFTQTQDKDTIFTAIKEILND